MFFNWRFLYQITPATTIIVQVVPPTTPPAIAPVLFGLFPLLLEEGSLEGEALGRVAELGVGDDDEEGVEEGEGEIKTP